LHLRLGFGKAGLQRVALAAELADHGHRFFHPLTEARQDLHLVRSVDGHLIVLSVLFHVVSAQEMTFTGSVSARRAASPAWARPTSSCVKERSRAWYHMPRVVLMVFSSPSGTKRSRRPTSWRKGTSKLRMRSTMR